MQVFLVHLSDEGATEAPGFLIKRRGMHDPHGYGAGELVVRALEGDDENGARFDARVEDQADAGGGDVRDSGDPGNVAARAEDVSGGLQAEGIARGTAPILHGRFLSCASLKRSVLRGHDSLAIGTNGES